MFYLQRVYLNTGGYEYGPFGQYWGTGLPLYRYHSDDVLNQFGREVYGTIRAHSRDEAKRQVRERFPNAKFFN